MQLAPFPFDLVMRELRRYPDAQLMWAQEEPLNMGAFHHVSPRIETVMRHEVHPAIRLSPAGTDILVDLTCHTPHAAVAPASQSAPVGVSTSVHTGRLIDSETNFDCVHIPNSN